MKLRNQMLVYIAGLITMAILLTGSMGGQSAAAAAPSADPITGEWNATFTIAGQSIPVELTFKLDGQVVTGTMVSEHTGSGTVNDGAWKDQKLTFIAKFASHESISMNGQVENGKLVGTFDTEGMQGTWSAARK